MDEIFGNEPIMCNPHSLHMGYGGVHGLRRHEYSPPARFTVINRSVYVAIAISIIIDIISIVIAFAVALAITISIWKA